MDLKSLSAKTGIGAGQGLVGSSKISIALRVAEIDARHLVVNNQDMQNFKALSAYRIMWLLVMFDLPVRSKKQRYEATKFRNFLLDLGFEMAQFSIYLRHCASNEFAQSLTKMIGANLPTYGKVSILSFTDKQYENIVNFVGRKRERGKGKPDQLTLF